MMVYLVVVWSKAKAWEVEQSPVSSKWSALASPAILLVVLVHQMFPLEQRTVGLPEQRSLLEMQDQILAAATTE